MNNSPSDEFLIMSDRVIRIWTALLRCKEVFWRIPWLAEYLAVFYDQPDYEPPVYPRLASQNRARYFNNTLSTQCLKCRNKYRIHYSCLPAILPMVLIRPFWGHVCYWCRLISRKFTQLISPEAKLYTISPNLTPLQPKIIKLQIL